LDGKIKILLVEDERLNWLIINEHFEQHYENFSIDAVETGQAAIAKLRVAATNEYNLVLLDRTIPDMDGIEILRYIKQNLSLVNLPVIFQTARANPQEILQGLTAGAYYLTKPYGEHAFMKVIQTALRNRSRYQRLNKTLVQHQKQRNDFADQMHFNFKTLDDVFHFSTLIANRCPDSEKIMLGLYELMINAIEHGNLNIGYTHKSDLLEADCWEAEVKRRQQLKENQEKYAEIDIRYHSDQIEFVICDQGNGFTWQDYLSFDTKRTCHGRGIAIARSQCFSAIEYYGKGNEVHAIYQLAPRAFADKTHDREYFQITDEQ